MPFQISAAHHHRMIRCPLALDVLLATFSPPFSPPLFHLHTTAWHRPFGTTTRYLVCVQSWLRVDKQAQTFLPPVFSHDCGSILHLAHYLIDLAVTLCSMVELGAAVAIFSPLRPVALSVLAFIMAAATYTHHVAKDEVGKVGYTLIRYLPISLYISFPVFRLVSFLSSPPPSSYSFSPSS